MYVQILWKGGYVEWRTVPWGKRGLDSIRRLGGTIIGYSE